LGLQRQSPFKKMKLHYNSMTNYTNRYERKILPALTTNTAIVVEYDRRDKKKMSACSGQIRRDCEQIIDNIEFDDAPGGRIRSSVIKGKYCRLDFEMVYQKHGRNLRIMRIQKNTKGEHSDTYADIHVEIGPKFGFQEIRERFKESLDSTTIGEGVGRVAIMYTCRRDQL
jgi:hypothetical protein